MKLQLLINMKKEDMNNMKSHKKLNLMELPMELVVEILKRVPAKSVCHIRCVSKKLLSIVDSPSFVTLHSTFLFDPDSHLPPDPPQRILHYRLPGTFYSLHYYQGAPQLNPRLILQSSGLSYNGLQFVFCNMFCISNLFNHALSFLINPLRGEVLKLPPSYRIAEQVGGPSCLDYVWHGMGFDSVTNTYKILRVREESCWEVQVLVLGTSEWRQVTSAPPPDINLSCFKNICAHGDMHWLVSGYTRQGIQGHIHILSFDFKTEEFFWIPNPYILRDERRQLQLVTFRGSMAIVDTTSGTNIEIWVMKDYNRKQWMLDDSINIHMLELDSQFEFMRAVCCEWEHGLLFLNEMGTTTLFLDLRGPVVTKSLLRCPIEGKSTLIRSLYGSLISLKSYANLEEAEEPVAYSNWSEGEASGKNFFYLTR